MSLVGPRPPLPEEVAVYPDDVRRRLAVKPGMTGLWQVSGRSDLPWEEAVRLDLRYVENWSLSLDLVILLRTLSAVDPQRRERTDEPTATPPPTAAFAALAGRSAPATLLLRAARARWGSATRRLRKAGDKRAHELLVAAAGALAPGRRGALRGGRRDDPPG